MSRLRLILRWEWLGYLVGVIVFAVACYGLSQWQFARRAEVVAEIHRVEQNYHARPVPLAELVATRTSFSLADEYRPITAHGRYLGASQVLVRNRPLDGQPGFEVLVPFRLDDGRVIAIDRGWLATGSTGGSPDVVPPAPTGEVTVVARIKQSQPDVARTAPHGQLASFYIPGLERVAQTDIYTGTYFLLDSETPAPAAAAPMQLPEPSTDEGSHLSYAFQWLAFGVLAFVALGYAVRTTMRRAAETSAAAGSDGAAELPDERPGPMPVLARRKRDADSEYEDHVLG